MCCEYQETINGEKLTVFFDIRNQLYVLQVLNQDHLTSFQDEFPLTNSVFSRV